MRGSAEEHALDIKRMKSLSFGEPVTNVCASSRNPMFHCQFVEYKVKSYRNRWGITIRYHYARCTNGKGQFCNFGIEIIYSGHLSEEEAKEVFAPIHRRLFPESYKNSEQEPPLQEKSDGILKQGQRRCQNRGMVEAPERQKARPAEESPCRR